MRLREEAQEGERLEEEAEEAHEEGEKQEKETRHNEGAITARVQREQRLSPFVATSSFFSQNSSGPERGTEVRGPSREGKEVRRRPQTRGRRARSGEREKQQKRMLFFAPAGRRRRRRKRRKQSCVWNETKEKPRASRQQKEGMGKEREKEDERTITTEKMREKKDREVRYPGEGKEITPKPPTQNGGCTELKTERNFREKEKESNEQIQEKRKERLASTSRHAALSRGFFLFSRHRSQPLACRELPFIV